MQFRFIICRERLFNFSLGSLFISSSVFYSFDSHHVSIFSTFLPCHLSRPNLNKYIFLSRNEKKPLKNLARNVVLMFFSSKASRQLHVSNLAIENNLYFRTLELIIQHIERYLLFQTVKEYIEKNKFTKTNLSRMMKLFISWKSFAANISLLQDISLSFLYFLQILFNSYSFIRS